ncbi:VOC family protein [Pseudonocardia sp. Cha107L01]|jgi:glyoxylase I family protein|uniref:VOC family protein n=1 Tax=Pseudonocardia sp. Cha107L01 TaxID=3457576 RepID=UPI00403E3A24
MTQVQEVPEVHPTTRPPIRLHHNAFLTRDQEKTRVFYEEIIGMPLVATWTEVAEMDDVEYIYCHTFYALADGSALAFFQFADQADQDRFGPDLPPSPFRHIALATDAMTQSGIRERIAAAGIVEPRTFVMDHGYCISLYITDPNGLILEFTVDSPDADAINKVRQESARADLARWLGGDHTPNNDFRH